MHFPCGSSPRRMAVDEPRLVIGVCGGSRSEGEIPHLTQSRRSSRSRRFHSSNWIYLTEPRQFQVWLFRHTLVAAPYKAYVKNEPYFKKWGGKIRYLKEKLDLLDDQEVFIDEISFEKRMDMIKEDHIPKVVSDKGSSSSTSKHEQDSDMNSVE
ncbi:hypothetical protein ZOSMA_11G00090 [Zostera marina]|uniref:Uncharacterized protein n=1 Tax=Zostera marina TaxID=29655 RepID=A0A0K9Q123_ZOSMR|nr:hypothetical protein ZOSMA_11G00090 [Zostera marina]